jgi:hypothetical protein
MTPRPQNRSAQGPQGALVHHPQRAQESTDGEHFDFTNLSDNGSDDNNVPARRSGHSAQQHNSQAHRQDAVVNDASFPVSDSNTKAAADIRYFFEKMADKTVCKVCR